MSHSKKVSPISKYSLLVFPLALGFVPLNAQAGCSRGDVDHYLDKGFSTSQIAAICGSAPEASAAPIQETKTPLPPKSQVSATEETPQQAVVLPQGSQPAQSSTTPESSSQPDRNFLIDVINGYDTVLTEELLAYTVKKCYEVGVEDLFGFPPEICPEIRYTLTLNGAKVVDTGRKYLFFGPPTIILKGQVQRDILTNLSEMDQRQQKSLRSQVDTGNELILPIQQGTPIERVQKEIRKVVR